MCLRDVADGVLSTCQGARLDPTLGRVHAGRSGAVVDIQGLRLGMWRTNVCALTHIVALTHDAGIRMRSHRLPRIDLLRRITVHRTQETHRLPPPVSRQAERVRAQRVSSNRAM